MTHTKHTWAAAPSANAAFTLARFENLAKQYDDIHADYGAAQGSCVVATATSKKKATADYVCDGTADEVQIQAAIDAVATVGGGTVVLLEGTYTTAANLELKSNVNLSGVSQGATIISIGASFALNINDKNSITVSNLKITGGAGSFVYVYGCDTLPGVLLDNVYLNIEWFGIESSYYVTVKNCTFYNTSDIWHSIDYSYYTTFTNCNFYGAYLGFTGSPYGIVEGCTFYGLSGYGIYFHDNSDYGLAIGNTFRKTTSDYHLDCIIVDECDKCLVIGNTVTGFDNSSEGGITLYTGGSCNAVIGNTVYDGVGARGICVGGTQYGCNISFNTVAENDSHGIGCLDTGVATIKYGVVNHNFAYKNGYDGLRLYGMDKSVVVGNSAYWNSQSADNTYFGIYTGHVASMGNSLIAANESNKGSSAPQQQYGMYINAEGDYCMVTMNYLAAGGATGALNDLATNTDKTAWMTDGNKIS